MLAKARIAHEHPARDAVGVPHYIAIPKLVHNGPPALATRLDGSQKPHPVN